MKKQFITEAARLQKLAGIITESQYRELNENKVWDFTKYIPNFDVKDLKIGDIIKSDNNSGSDTSKVLKITNIEPDEYYPEQINYDVQNIDGNGRVFRKEDFIYLNDRNKPGYQRSSTSLPSPDQDSFIPLSPEVKEYINNIIQDAKDSGEFDYLLDVGFFGTDLADDILTNFGDDYPNAYMLSKQVEDYIDSQL
jgi:hypothetical protein